MRTINAQALAAINQTYGLEAINIVRVYWSSTPTDYCDKAEMEQQYDNLQARVLEISGLDNIISMDRSTASTSITVKLDDSDSAIRNIINSADMQKRPVQILQWFTNAPVSEAFVLFTGEIATPMEWSEGDRTFSFAVVSKVENIELGFSLEEGVIEAIPVNMWDKPFPIVFGNVYKSPALLVGDSPSGILAEGFVWLNTELSNIPKDDLNGSGASPTQSSAQLSSSQAGQTQSESSGLTVYQYELDKLSIQLNKIYLIAQQLYRQSILVEVLAASYNSGDAFNGENYQAYQKYHQQSEQLYQQSQQYAQQYLTILGKYDALLADYEQKKAFEFNPVPVYSQNIPQNIPLVIEIGETRFNAQYNGTLMYLFDQILPPNLPPQRVHFGGTFETYTYNDSYKTQEQKKYLWFDAGSKVRVINLPMYYIACQGTTNDIVAVYGRSYGVRVPLPPYLYSIEYYPFTNGDGVTITATVIVVNQPLTTLYDNAGNMMYQTDDIWCDIRSSVAGGLVPILLWTIANYTHENVSDIGPITADPVSFDEVNVYTNASNNPMNFTVVERKNVIDFMKEICLQARVAIWMDNGLIKLRYLPRDPTADATITITPQDVVENTLVIMTDDTELLKTKVIGKWRPSMDQEVWNEIVERVNIGEYGVLTETITCYCYQAPDLVRRCVGYWAQKWGHTWKKIKLKTHIGLLQLEGQDPVILSGFNNLFADGSCVGIVETAKYDSQNLQIEFEIWLPILWGSMTPYIWAYPQNVTVFYGPAYIEYNTYNPFQGSFDSGGLMTKPSFRNYQAPAFSSGPHQLNDQPPEFVFDTTLTQTLPGLSGAPLTWDTIRRPPDLQLANASESIYVPDPPPIDDPLPDINDVGTVVSYLGNTTQANFPSTVNSQLYKVQSLTTTVDSGTLADNSGYSGGGSFSVGATIPTGVNNTVPAGVSSLGGGTYATYNVIQVDIADGWQIPVGTVVAIFRKAGLWYMQSPTWDNAQTGTTAAGSGTAGASGGGSFAGGGSVSP